METETPSTVKPPTKQPSPPAAPSGLPSAPVVSMAVDVESEAALRERLIERAKRLRVVVGEGQEKGGSVPEIEREGERTAQVSWSISEFMPTLTLHIHVHHTHTRSNMHTHTHTHTHTPI